MNYPSIADHGLIGDLQTAALVTTEGSIDWFCALVSTRRASSGRCSTTRRAAGSAIRPVADDYTSKQLYLPGHGRSWSPGS